MARRSAASSGEGLVCLPIIWSPWFKFLYARQESDHSRIARVSRNASIPYLPYSRPKPEYLNPPQGPCGSSVMPLITTRPARICEATRRAREVGPKDGGVETIFGIVGDPD